MSWLANGYYLAYCTSLLPSLPCCRINSQLNKELEGKLTASYNVFSSKLKQIQFLPEENRTLKGMWFSSLWFCTLKHPLNCFITRRIFVVQGFTFAWLLVGSRLFSLLGQSGLPPFSVENNPLPASPGKVLS